METNKDNKDNKEEQVRELAEILNLLVLKTHSYNCDEALKDILEWHKEVLQEKLSQLEEENKRLKLMNESLGKEKIDNFLKEQITRVLDENETLQSQLETLTHQNQELKDKVKEAFIAGRSEFDMLPSRCQEAYNEWSKLNKI
jgi:exonuclease VII large subunit